MGVLTRPCECGSTDSNLVTGVHTTRDEKSLVAQREYGPYCPDCQAKRTGTNSPNSGLFKLVASIVVIAGIAGGWFAKDGYRYFAQRAAQVYHDVYQDGTIPNPR